MCNHFFLSNTIPTFKTYDKHSLPMIIYACMYIQLHVHVLKYRISVWGTSPFSMRAQVEYLRVTLTLTLRAQVDFV